MTREQLKERSVRRLPMQPGVYMHKDKTGKGDLRRRAAAPQPRVHFQPPKRLNAKTRR